MRAGFEAPRKPLGSPFEARRLEQEQEGGGGGARVPPRLRPRREQPESRPCRRRPPCPLRPRRLPSPVPAQALRLWHAFEALHGACRARKRPRGGNGREGSGRGSPVRSRRDPAAMARPSRQPVTRRNSALPFAGSSKPGSGGESGGLGVGRTEEAARGKGRAESGPGVSPPLPQRSGGHGIAEPSAGHAPEPRPAPSPALRKRLQRPFGAP